MNDSMKEIAEALNRASRILIYTHQNMDGDAAGSSAAMCRALRNAGKEAWILQNEEDVSADIAFLIEGLATKDETVIPDPDVSLALDASQTRRFPNHAEKFRSAATKIAVDHHLVENEALDLCLIDPKASATGELVYFLLREMGADIDRDIAACLFAAITTDTGNFQYSNTTPRAFSVAGELLKTGLDAASVSARLYESEKPEKIRLHALVLKDYQIWAGGRLAMALLTQETLKKSGAELSDSEGIVASLRRVRGVEIAAFLKQDRDGKIFVSLRAKGEADVRRIAEKFGGGGHIKAAGCTIEGMRPDEAYEQVRLAAEHALRKQFGEKE